MGQRRFSKSDWERLYEDWKESGLKKSAYVRSERYKSLFAGDSVPTRWTVAKRLSSFPRFQRSAVSVSTLNENDITRALNREPQAVTGRTPRPMQVVLGNGTRIEFESISPERFALQALLICGGRR